jgi:hypothetical protein
MTGGQLDRGGGRRHLHEGTGADTAHALHLQPPMALMINCGANASNLSCAGANR